MLLKSKIVLISLASLMLAAASSAYAAESGGAAAAALGGGSGISSLGGAADAINSAAGGTLGAGQGLDAALSGVGNAADPADTTAPEAVQHTNTDINIDPSASQPDTTVVNEQSVKHDNKKLPGTTSAVEGGAVTDKRLDPREADGSSMYDNLRGRLERFGMDFFKKRRANTLMYAPVGPSYMVAPGDEVKLNIWGFNEVRANLVVDRDGMLALPQAGVVQAAGLTFSELERAVRSAYESVITDFEMNLSMGKLHTINVYVTGNAMHPGAYAVSSIATLVDVISEAGGPSLSGTMRSVEVKRAGRRIAVIDLYQLIRSGNRKNDVRLCDGDVIHIPVVGKLVAVAGSVKRAGVYEINGKARVDDLIRLAGGLASGAFKGRVQIVRVKDNVVRTAFEGELSDNSLKNEYVHDGDLVKIFSVYGGSINARIAGAIVQPGVYAIDEGKTTLRDLINRSGGLLYTAAKDAELTRIAVSESGPVTTRIYVNIDEVMKGSGNITLNRDDYLFVRTVPDWNIYRNAVISGRVLYPGSYAIKQGERLSSLLKRAGGFAENAFPRGAVFIRESVRQDQQRALDDMIVRIEKEMRGAANKAVSTATTARDESFAKSEIAQKEKLIEALRGVKASGRIILHIPAGYTQLQGSPFDLEIQNGDRVYIPHHPETIQVIGSVLTQAAFAFFPGQSIREYIRLAGGYMSTANGARTYIMKADGSTVRAFSAKGKETAVVEEGDCIVVPEKFVFAPSMRNIQDVLDIFHKIAISTASIRYLFKN